MRTIALLRAALVVPMIFIVPAVSSAQINVSITVGPPELPVYEQPAIPDDGYIWAPGYWAYGPDGYFWVPGTWVQPPQPDYLWTPGYWAWNNGSYGWNDGYWATQVGYYGGINYGYGYGGDGYQGGYWNGGRLYYNRTVNNFGSTNVTNVYNKTVIVNNTTITNVSYNGGPGGVAVRATAAQMAVSRGEHRPPTAVQTQHVEAARGNRAQLASVNHGQPAVVATPKPGVFSGKGVVTQSRVTAAYRAPASVAVAKGDVGAQGKAAPGAPDRAVGQPAGRPVPQPVKAAPQPVKPVPQSEDRTAPKAEGKPADAPVNKPQPMRVAQPQAKVDQPEVKAAAPKAEAPKPEAPKAEAPKAEAPKAEAPKAETRPEEVKPESRPAPEKVAPDEKPGEKAPEERPKPENPPKY